MTKGQLEAWERDGFLVAPEFASPDELKMVRERIELLANQDPPNPATQIDLEKELAGAVHLTQAQRLRGLFHAAHADQVLREGFTLRDKTLDVVEDLLGSDFVFYSDQTFFKPPGGSAIPPHQDNAYWEPYWPGPDKLSVWLALDASTRENGCTVFVPGSHKEAFAHETDFERDPVFGRELVVSPEHETIAVPVELEPGDCCIHHCETVHWSAPNNSGRPRRGHIAIYFGSRTQHIGWPDGISTPFRHAFIPARGRTFPRCVGWRKA